MSYRYKKVRISRESTRDQHRITAEKIIGRRLNSNEIVHHINGNSLDNRPENLLVMTREQHGRIHFIGSKSLTAVLNESKVSEIKRRLLKHDLSHKELAREFGVSPSTIGDICTGRTWKHVA